MKIIRFTALWCADCIVMRPRWQEVFGPEVTIEDFDFDDNEEEAKKYQVTKVPQLIIVDDQNAEQERLVGMQDAEKLQELVQKYFNSTLQ